MGEVTTPQIDIEAELRKHNPALPAVTLRLYADALRTYLEAAANVREKGAIVMHPRTGSPMENPYLKIQQKQAAVLDGFKRVRGDKVLALLVAP